MARLDDDVVSFDWGWFKINRKFLLRAVIASLLLVAVQMPGYAGCPENSHLQLGDKAPPGSIQVARLSSDGKKVAAVVVDGSVVLWDIATGTKSVLLDCIPRAVQAMEFVSGQYKVAIGDAEGTVHILSASAPGHETTFSAGQESIEALSLSSDGEFLAVVLNAKSTVDVWSFSRQSLVASLGSCDKPGQSVTFSADSRKLAAICTDKRIKVWDVETRSVMAEVSVASTDYVNAVAFGQKESEILVATGNGKIEVFSFDKPEPSTSLTGHSDQIVFIRILDNDELISSSEDGTAKFWNISKGKLLRTVSTPPGEISQDGRLLLAQIANSTSSGLSLWSLETGKQISELK